MNRRQSTIIDVAQLADVSSATVSRALRGLPNVTPATRQRVEEAARSLNYHADPSASRLASGRSSSVAMILPFIDTWYFASVVAGVEAVLTEAGYELALYVTGNVEARHRLLRDPMPRSTGGMIIVDVSFGSEEVDTLLASGVPAVSVGMFLDGVSTVTVDDEAVGRMATTHLLDLGHTSIALLGGADADYRFTVPIRRRAGYRSALADARLPTRPDYDVNGVFTAPGGYAAMGRLLDLEDPPTAVFAMSDEMAFGALKAARDRGVRVPEDISIIGVDDHPLSWVEDLTTVHQEVCDHGSLAAIEILELIDEPGRPLTHLLAETTMVVRGTTAPLGGAGSTAAR